MKKLSEKRNIHGFTLIEVLVTLAIIAVLAAIFTPGAAALRSRLKMTELDNNARQLFLSAQSELTAEKGAGRLAGLGTALETKTLSEKPEDYGDGTDWPQLRYVSTQGDAALCESWFPDTCAALGEMGGSMCMELNPLSGDVYGVFYSEGNSDYSAIRGELSTRERAERKTYLLGYWGGSGVYSISDSASSDLALAANIVNAEELYLNVGCPGLTNAFGKADNVAATVSVTDESGNTASLTLDGNQTSDVAGVSVATDGTYSMTLLLDGMGDGQHFSEIMQKYFALADGSAAYPSAGDNIGITVALAYTDADGATRRGAASFAANSLFASKATVTDTKNTADVSDDTRTVAIGVGYLRQLNNLRSAYYPYAADSAAAVTVSQTRAIDFAAGSDYWKANTRGASANPLAKFMPILNAALFGGNTVYEGSGNALSNFTIGGSTSGTGIFAAFGGAELRDARVVNPTIVSPGEYTGALVGQITGATKIKNCGAYLDLGDGKTDEDYKIVTSENYMGGLVGSTVSRVAISDSFAAINILSTGESAGGLVGSFGGGTITNSYSSGDVTGTTNAGGLAGACQSAATLSKCYSTSDVTATTNVGGLVGLAKATLTASDTAAYGLITADAAGPFAGSGTVSYGSGCAYLKQSNYNADFAAITGLTASSYDDLYTVNSAKNSHPYSAELTGAFPFAMVTTEHWGNWPVKAAATVSGTYFCYYEIYSDGTYGVYFPDADGNIQSSLDTTLDPATDKTISDWGYGVLSSESKRPQNRFYNGNNKLNNFKSEGAVSTDFGDFTLYTVTGKTEKKDIVMSNYQAYVSITDKTSGRIYQVNSYYGAAICDASKATLGTEAAPFGLRTTDQLANLAYRTRIHSYAYFSQTHNIDADDTTGGFNARNSQYTYNGNSYQIIGLTQNLFTTVDSTSVLQDIHLANVNIEKTTNASALASTNYGTITGCKMYSGSVTSTYGSAAGLILTSDSVYPVTHCGVLGGSVASSRGSAAGLVLTLTSGTISDCTVGTIGGSETSVTVTASGVAATGMVGTTTSGTAIVNGRVAWTNVSNTDGRAAGLAAFNSSAITKCLVDNCKITASDHSAGLCIDNSSTITGSGVWKCSMTSSDGTYPYACGFVYSNKNDGTVSECYAAGVTVRSSGGSGDNTANSAGFINENWSAVTRCYADVVSVSGPSAAGFIVNNKSQASVTDCYAVGAGASGTVTGTTSAAGFCLSGGGTKYWGASTLANCYAAVSVSGGTKYGFGGPTNLSNTNCRWCYLEDFNNVIADNGVGTKTRLAALKSVNMGTNWTTSTTAAQTHPLTMTGQAYPYPRLTALEHWGDWPVRYAKVGLAVRMMNSTTGYNGFFGAVLDTNIAGKSAAVAGASAVYTDNKSIYLLLGNGLQTYWAAAAYDPSGANAASALAIDSSATSITRLNNTDIAGYTLYLVKNVPPWFASGDYIVLSGGIASYYFKYTSGSGGVMTMTYTGTQP